MRFQHQKMNLRASIEWKTLQWYKNRKPHQWVLFQVNKIYKTRCLIYQMHSKRKSHNGCCQMCIEMAKIGAKT